MAVPAAWMTTSTVAEPVRGGREGPPAIYSVPMNMDNHTMIFNFNKPGFTTAKLNNTMIRINTLNGTTGDGTWKIEDARFDKLSHPTGNITGFFYHVLEVDGRLVVTGQQTHVDWLLNGTFQGLSPDGVSFGGNWTATLEPDVQPTVEPSDLPTARP